MEVLSYERFCNLITNGFNYETEPQKSTGIKEKNVEVKCVEGNILVPLEGQVQLLPEESAILYDRESQKIIIRRANGTPIVLVPREG